MKVSGYEIIEAFRPVLRETERLRWQHRETVVAAAEPIAIVAMSCRFPGGVASPEDLWRLVTQGDDAIGLFPVDRGWDVPMLAAGGSAVPAAGFLADAAGFDAAFFGIPPREAALMDPRQRLLLEITWEAFERAGIDPAGLRGSATGVFVGTTGQDRAGIVVDSRAEAEAGTATGVLSDRLSSSFGLDGPAATVATGCSSSLVAVHLAARSLRSGACSLALAGGVTVMATPALLMESGRRGEVAADARCKAFAEAADGTGWSEGAGLLLLERLSDARRNGHEVLGIVRGSAVDHGVAAPGRAAPDGPHQQRLIRQALRSAGLSAADVDAVEADGSGVPAGDRIEAQALLATYGQNRARPFYLGSIKSNLGHTQAAAGVAGVIKMVLAMRHGVLPRTLHVDRPSSRVDWTTGTARLLTAATDWPETGRPRRAGVSSFGAGAGAGGAHVILEQPAAVAPRPATPAPAVTPWVVSAKSDGALSEQVGRLGALDAAAADVGFSLATTRSAFAHRAVLLAGAGEPVEVARGLATERSLAFVFSGPGPRWLGAGRELYQRFPAFAAAFDGVMAAFGDPVPVGDRARVKVFAVEVALFRLLESFGVRPDFLAGQSVGEIAAAQVAGVLSLRDACTLVQACGRLARADPGVATLADFGQVVGSLAFGEPRIPLVTAGDIGTADHWERQMRATVRFDDVGTALSEAGVTAYLEVGPGEVLTSRIGAPLTVAALRHDRPEVDALLTAVGRLWVAGVGVDWPGITAGGRRVDLPTYAFQHKRFWPRPDGRPGDAARPGTAAAEHPLLGAAIQAGGPGTVLFTGRLSAAEQPWLAPTGRFPVAGFVELALHAGSLVGCERIDELTFFRPLTVPPGVTVFVKAEVAAPGTDGVRPVGIYSRRAGDPAGSWTEHASGVLVAGGRAGVADAGAWPPSRAVAADHGAHPLLRGVWQDGDETYVEAALPAGAGYGGRYGIHPALLDAITTAAGRTVAPDDAALVPLCWTGMSLHAPGATVLRARITRTRPDETAIVAVDRQGAPVLSVDSLAWAAPVDDLWPIATGHGDLLCLMWTPVTLPANPADAPGSVVVPITAGGDAAADAHVLTGYVLKRIHQWLAEDRPAAARLVFTTRDAVAAEPGDPVGDVAAAAVWGLVRAAQAEHPGRFVLIDRAGDGAPTLAALLATDEPQLLVRGDTVLAGRLARCARNTTGPDPAPWDPDGTVLIAGAAGGLGGELARHLVAERGIRHLVLVSRRGQAAPGAVVLQAELIAHGVEVTFAACDIADRAGLARVVAAVPDEHPLTAVVHAVGVPNDGFVMSLTPQQLSAALGPKAGGAWHLHELTLGASLAAFVTFSSISSVIGCPGQAGNAAPDAFLDALAQHRAGAGLPATSIAWGTWEKAGRPLGQRSTQDVRRPAAPGVAPLSVADGLALFDAATRTSAANLVAIAGFAGLARAAGEVPAVLRGLIRGGRRRPGAAEHGDPWHRPDLGSRRLEWVPAPAVPTTAITWSMLDTASHGPTPTLILAELAGSPGEDVADAVHEITVRTLGLVHQWLADRSHPGTPLVIHTRHAVAAEADEHVEDLAGAAAWEVVRAVQAEHPGRFALLDGDVDDTILARLPGLIATGDAQFAVRHGALLVGRLATTPQPPGGSRSDY